MNPVKRNLKRTYSKPVVKSEKIIETAALSCSKCLAGNPIYQGACKSFSRMS